MPTFTPKLPQLLRRAALLLPLLCLSWLAQAQSSQEYYNSGSLSYQTTGAADNRQVQFRVQETYTDFAIFSRFLVGVLFPTAGTIDFGDGTAPEPVNLTVLSRNNNGAGGNNSFIGEYNTTHTYATAGSYTVIVRGNERFAGGGSKFVFSTVVGAGAANDSPVWAANSSVILYQVKGVDTYTYQVPVSDPNGDALTYSLATAAETGDTSGYLNPPELSIDARTGLLSFNTVTAETDNFYVAVVKVSDGKTSIIIDELILLVSNFINTAPVFVAPTPANGQIVRTAPGRATTFTVRATDADAGDVVSLQVSGLPPGAVLTPTLPASGNPAQTTFSFTPTAAQVGDYALTFTAQDRRGGRTTTSVALKVYPTLAPVFTASSSSTINGQFYSSSPNNGQVFTVAPGQPVRFVVAADDRSDPDERVSLRALDLPPGATFTALPRPLVPNGAQSAFAFTPTAASVGRYAITFAAEDSQGLRTDLYVNIQVVNSAPPVFTAPTPANGQVYTVVPGQVLSFTVQATDADAGDVVTLRATGGGAVLTPDLPTSGNPVQTTFTFAPTAAQTGEYTVAFTVRDSRGIEGMPVVITIQVPAACPAVVPITPPVVRPDQLTASCGPITITPAQLLANDTDPLGRPLRVSGVGLASSGTLVTNADGTFTYTPAPGFTGPARFVYQVLPIDGSGIVVFTSPATGHYYEYVTSNATTWPSAVFLAASRSFFALKGYLATITSAAEMASLQGRNAGNYWIGASDEAVEGEWRWKTGPEAGQLFWRGGPDGTPLAYANWSPGQPDGLQDQYRPEGEDYALLFGNSSQWADFNRGGTGTTINGYVIEYGGLEACTPVFYGSSTVTINVQLAAQVVAGADQLRTPVGQPLTLTAGQLLANDAGPQGQPLQLSNVTAPSSGRLAPNANGTFTYTPDPNFVGTVSFTYDVSPAGRALASSATGHFYEFVTLPGRNSWTAARDSAAARTYLGQRGYLATITSAAEKDFLAGRNGTNSYWIGAADDVVEGEWRWKTGPEAGQLFWRGGPDGTPLAYANWSPGEPNDYKNQFRPEGEDYAQLYSESGFWNDVANVGGTTGYVVEYGGLEGCAPTLVARGTVTIQVGPAAQMQVLASTAKSSAAARPTPARASSAATLEALPNPSAGQFRLRVSAVTEGAAQLDVYDMQGRRVKAIFAGSLRAGEVRELAVDAPELASGVYLVRLQSGQQVQHLRIVVQK